MGGAVVRVCLARRPQYVSPCPAHSPFHKLDVIACICNFSAVKVETENFSVTLVS